MEIISMGNWQAARDIIALMICFVAISCLIKGKSRFHHFFYREIGKDYHKQIKKELCKLQTYNAQLEKVMKYIVNSEGIHLNGYKTEKSCKKKISDTLQLVYPRKKTRPKISVYPDNGANMEMNPAFQKVRLLYDTETNEEEIYNHANIPQAELDFKLKFERLSKLRKARIPEQYQGARYRNM